MADTPMSVAIAFVEAINAADLSALRRLMTEDHTFIDTLGNHFSGADQMIVGWQNFFLAYPDYRIQIRHAFADGMFAGIFGHGEGKWRVDKKILPGSWSVATAWLAEIEAGQVKTWRVFGDTGWAAPPGASYKDR